MPDLGLIPEFLGTDAAAPLSALTGVFNANLALTLTTLGAAIPSIDIVQFDTAALFAELAADPQAFGFDVATSAVWRTGTRSVIPRPGSSGIACT